MAAIQIILGEGKIAMNTFQDADGRGLIFRDTGTVHEIGEYEDTPDVQNYIPQDGEVYIKCLNVEAAKAMRQSVDDLIERFEKGGGA